MSLAFKTIALAGNPNVGKSTIFNSLTGLNQHTGNWPGKTVACTQGNYNYKNQHFLLVDIPGTYSLMANSLEEEIARDFICFNNPDATIIVVDATCLERNLNLVLQTIEITSKVIVCVNLLDEAARKGISINLKLLSTKLGVPVIGTSATKGEGLNNLLDAIYNISNNNTLTNPIDISYEDIIEDSINKIELISTPVINSKLNTRWVALRLLDGDEKLLKSIYKFSNYDFEEDISLKMELAKIKEGFQLQGINTESLKDKIVTHLVALSEKISKDIISFNNTSHKDIDRKIDKFITSKRFGIPIMIFLLFIVFWITISGANIPSKILSNALFWLEDKLSNFFILIKAPLWIEGLFVKGIYRTLAWVISVMLPPMAIFFPLFTLLEDLGYLPRVAFNLDNFFKKANTCGKQALTMCMGFGCNAAAVIGCRIIDSPRERLIAIITNSFIPCNGRFPTLISIIIMFFAGIAAAPFQTIISTLILTSIILFGIFMSLLMSKLLSKTILKGIPSNFTLELPPYRKPQIGNIIVRSIFDRTLFVLGRAVLVAAPAGLIIWVMANIHINDFTLLTHLANFLNPFAKLIGLDGYILMAFILGLPANEIVFPIIIMSYLSTGNLIELDNLINLKNLLVANGWTWVTAVCVLLFSLIHFPCATTCLTIKKETKSLKWTAISFLAPTITGIFLCFIFTHFVKLISYVNSILY